ncbi:hypothetical protein AMJ49_04375 [Parcubacteria bacterium DG_74_2]|nr:MAG: hypothetical protein AMJ49_04375 [Parcubacteria bacterium DG_74_2]
MINQQQKIISIFEIVRDIPYGVIDKSRNFCSVLENHKGTCSGKHLLLGRLYELMGIKVKYMMCETRFNFIKIELPEDLQKILDRKEIIDYHNFIKIRQNSKWINVDATFDLPLKKYSPAVNHSWNGVFDCQIAFKLVNIFETKNLKKEKVRLINFLTNKQQKEREAFFEKLSNWLDKVRNNTGKKYDKKI